MKYRALLGILVGLNIGIFLWQDASHISKILSLAIASVLLLILAFDWALDYQHTHSKDTH